MKTLSLLKPTLFTLVGVASAALAARPPNGVTFLKARSPMIEFIRIDANKTIHRYPSANHAIEMNVMRVNGRSPMNPDHFIYNTVVHFMVYVTRGTGLFFVDNDTLEASVGDVLDVPPKTRFAAYGEGLEYVTIENPSFFREQGYVVNRSNEIVSP